MTDEEIKIFNHETIIENKKNEIMEEFISFYGEERRKEIEKKFSQVKIIPYIPMDIFIQKVKEVKKKKASEIIEKMGEKNPNELLFDKFSFPKSTIFEYYKYVDNKESSKIPYTIAFILKDENLMKYLNDNRAYFTSLLDEYNKSLEPIKDKIELCDNIEKQKNKIKEKKTIEFIESYKDFLGDIYTEVINYYNKYGTLPYNPKINMLCGLNFDDFNAINKFDIKYEEKIASDSSVKSDRIKYFKTMGIDLGSDYEAYKNSEECKKIWPSQEFIEQLSEKRREYKKEIKEELYGLYPDYSKAKATLKGEEILDPIDLTEYFEQGVTALSPNVKKTTNGFEMTSFIFVNMSREFEGLDQSIFHELNHLVELEIDSVSEKGIDWMSGWDKIHADFSGIETNKPRENELFSEIINDLLAERIARNYHEKGKNIVSNPDKAKYNIAGYRRTVPLVLDFYKKYYDLILQSRNNNISNIVDVVGKENFSEFSALFTDFELAFGGMKILKLMTDEEKGLETDLTKKKKEIFDKKDELIKKMEEYTIPHGITM